MPANIPPNLAKAPEKPIRFPARASVTGWCEISGMGRTSTYEALRRRDLHAVKMGTRTLIDVARGLEWLDSLPPA
jgi:hypothetical protein